MAQSSVASCGGVAAGSPASGLGSEAAAAFGRGSVRAGLRLGRVIATIAEAGLQLKRAVLARRPRLLG